MSNAVLEKTSTLMSLTHYTVFSSLFNIIYCTMTYMFSIFFTTVRTLGTTLPIAFKLHHVPKETVMLKKITTKTQ